MTKDWTAVPVPAPPLLLKEFLAMEQKHYVRTLEVVRDEVSKAVQPLGVYKIYGRDEKQKGVLLKDARKARLKFNDHFMKRKESLGSLWSMPDVVGFTVVAYPSDINAVAAAIDELVDSGKFVSVSDASVKTSGLIRTKHGRVIENGYFVHYNLRISGTLARTERTGQSARFKSRPY